ncbi:MAG: hypothetical protein CL625_00330 [Arenimonas sp.]|nr:hypothetical protein [Arenimonas sp.]
MRTLRSAGASALYAAALPRSAFSVAAEIVILPDEVEALPLRFRLLPRRLSALLAGVSDFGAFDCAARPCNNARSRAFLRDSALPGVYRYRRPERPHR